MSVREDGTFVLPDDWRFVLDGSRGVYLMQDGGERCINLIPDDAMEKQLASIRKQAESDPDMNEALAVIGQNASRICVASDGSIEIPERLRRFADINGNAVLVGAVRMIKIWNQNELMAESPTWISTPTRS